MAVEWGHAHRDVRRTLRVRGVQAIGIDEIAWRTLSSPRSTRTQRVRNHCKRLLWIGQERKVKTLLRFFHWFGAERSRELKYLCSDSEFASDMWKPYLKVIAKKAGRAVHVLDRFHIMAHFSKAIDEVRAKEVKELKAKGYEPVLTKTRWLLLKRPENLTGKQETKLADLLHYNLRSVRAYLRTL